MATDNFVQPAIPRFDGHYDHWSMLMENFLRSKEYWQVVSDGIPESEVGSTMSEARKTEIEGLHLKDLKAKNYLFQAIDHSILETILNKDTSKDIWDSMKKKYQGSARAKRQQLQTLHSKFKTLRMKSVEKILRSMTPKFNFVVFSIEEAHDIEELSIDELQSSLLIHEQKITQQEKEEQALKSSTEIRSTSKGSKHKGKSRGSNDRGNNQEHQQFTQIYADLSLQHQMVVNIIL
uniref:Retrovirus-related Pol polyprotein from transposon TNT 1-94 n=1 Tax=Cajanus cajan TaxID=3821 RepID=A0A151RDS5_CAJCA|nr:hypothetical protein KK1_037948 [Cajanus cajan]